MPWHGVSPMDLRRLFVRAHALGGVSMTELCEHFGVSRNTGYKWVARVEQGGPSGRGAPLSSTSRTPDRTSGRRAVATPGQTPPVRRRNQRAAIA